MGEARRRRNARWDGVCLPVVDRDNREKLKKLFPEGTWIFGVGPHKGCSPVFYGKGGGFFPFDYLGDYSPASYRVATDQEIQAVRARL